MNRVTVLFAFTTVAFGVSSMYVAQKLRAERLRADTLQDRVTQFEQAARAAEARETRSTSTTRPQDLKDAPAPIARKKSDPPDTNRGWDGEKFSRRLTNPTYRAAQIAYLRLEMEQKYPDLAEALNLRPDEADQFLDLLATQALSEREHEIKINDDGKVSDQTVVSRRQASEERRRVADAERVALLGEAKLLEWNQYEKSLGARAQVRELQMLLAESNFPLRDDQFGPLVAALAAEQQRHATERDQLYNGTRNPTQPTSQEVIRYMAQRLDLIEKSLKRQRQAAALYLSSEQQKRYDEMLIREQKRAQIDYDVFVTLNMEQPRNP
jgi:hypothetical protein